MKSSAGDEGTTWIQFSRGFMIAVTMVSFSLFGNSHKVGKKVHFHTPLSVHKLEGNQTASVQHGSASHKSLLKENCTAGPLPSVLRRAVKSL